jgi:hypothetical protein
VPPPRAHLLTYHGVLAPAAALRAAIVPGPPASRKRRQACATASTNSRSCGRHPWAELIKRVFLVDVLRCPRCGGRRKILAAITDGRVIRAILTSLGLPSEPPAVHPARGPPDELLWA